MKLPLQIRQLIPYGHKKKAVWDLLNYHPTKAQLDFFAREIDTGLMKSEVMGPFGMDAYFNRRREVIEMGKGDEKSRAMPSARELRNRVEETRKQGTLGGEQEASDMEVQPMTLAERIGMRAAQQKDALVMNNQQLVDLERLEYLLGKHKEVAEIFELWKKVGQYV